MGNIELCMWVMLFGVVGDVKVDVYCYEFLWYYGNVVVEWLV